MIKWLMNPKIAVLIFVVFLISYIAFIDEEGGFSKNFLSFGPSQTRFLGIKMDSWPKVISVYCIGFLAAIMTTYYDTVVDNHIHSYIWNKAIKKVPFSKMWTHIIVFLEPFFDEILAIIQFFTTMTMQLQFLIPQFIGHFIADVPFTLQTLASKKFSSA
jgi:hypothetical protein